MGSLDLRADELIYTYDCDTLPYSPGAGWEIANACNAPQCSESIADGHFILDWPPNMGDIVNYDHTITPSGTPPPPTLWIEWRFRSTLPLPPTSPGCDGRMSIVYDRIGEVVYLHGTGAVSFEGGQFILGLPLNEFHTYRFESFDGLNYNVAVNGQVFITDVGGGIGGTRSRLQFSGQGGCPLSIPLGTHNEWDYVRYGRLTTGETIIAADPPAGYLDPVNYSNLDRFTVTFDQPCYVYVDDVVVDVEGSEATRQQGNEATPLGKRETVALGVATVEVPIVIATRRQDNGPPETVEIVFDRALTPADGTVRFTFNTGAATPQIVEYTLMEFQTCCLPDGACAVLPPDDCSGQEGAPVGALCDGDADGDGLDGACGDSCPNDPAKFAPGLCGCGVSDFDSDEDMVPDCLDQCPGQDDLLDANADGTPDCLEKSPIIPTASTWGLVVLALVLLIAAKLVFPSWHSRRSAAAG
jgi:hypothetical protein